MFRLSENQQKIVDSDARIKLIMGAHRSGKTTVLLSCLLNEMKKLNSKDTKIVVYEIDIRYARLMMREIKRYFGDIIYTINSSEMVFETTYGVIEILKLDTSEAIPINYDIVVMDGASRNKYLDEILYRYSCYCNENGLAKLIIAGHCPEDTNNAFYKQWCTAFYSVVKDTEAFKLKTWDNFALALQKEELEKEMLSHMSLERYIRDYYAVNI